MPNPIESLLCRLPLCLALLTGSALAQSNPELGDNGNTALAPAPAPITTSETTTSGTTTTTTVTETTVATSGNDHATVIGHFGVGTFGVLDLPVMGCGAAAAAGCTDTNGTLVAPTIGARYWLDERMAIEAALGIGYRSGSTSTAAGNTTTEVSEPSLFGLALHGGLPLVFASSAHFAFELIPELNVGFVTGGRNGTTAANDVSLSGFLLELGARVGAEIQFGFIDIPQLALQGTVGLHMRYEGRSASVNNVDISNHRFGIGTSVNGEPWDIFTGNIAAIYYF
jgi:hypothetical protein